MRAVPVRALWLILVLGWCLPAHPSTCLKQTAPEVAPFLVTGNAERIREAITALEDRAGISDAGRAAPWLAAQASMQLDIGATDEAITRLRRAISGWLENGEVAAEVCTRHLLVFALTLRSEPRLALSETLLAEARAREAGLEAALNRLRQTHITLLLTLNERLEHALVLMNETRPGESAAERINWHHVRGLMLGRLNRHRQAAGQFEQVVELAAAEGMADMVAAARLNLANQLARRGRDDPLAVPEDRVTALLEEVADDPAARPATRAMALRSLAQYRQAPERLELLRECEHQARIASDDRRRAVCLADRAEWHVDRDPRLALELIDRAVALSENDPRALWQIQAQRLTVIWATEPPPRAFDLSMDAIDGERRLRDLQMTGPERAALIDGLSWDYRRLADLAYRHSDEHPALAERAFELLAANRALVLREERLARSDDGELTRIQALAGRINRAQKRLLSPNAEPRDLERARDEIRRLEAAWHKAAVRPPEPAAAMLQGPALDSIRAALAPDEALLSFLSSIPGRSGPLTGWLHVVTDRDSRLYAVPPDRELVDAAMVLEGLPDWRQQPAYGLLADLAGSMLASALAELGPGIRHLVIVPDRGIDRLPLESLPDPRGQPLGIRYSIDTAPSAGVWLDARQAARATGPILALADPELPENGYRALDAAYPGLTPPRLPGAAGEARLIRRLTGGGNVRIRTGSAAGEGTLAHPPSSAPVGLVHFATHALIHPDDHDRSAVLLAADRHGDGLLQPREIERLGLAGVAVVLASCASATGERLDNEGIISLARSFMIAGAPSVIATRWAVDDRHAQAFVQRFYWHLVNGRDQSSAMRLARADLHARGYPHGAWAAWVLIGDGRWQPLPERSRWPAWAALALAAGLAIVLLARMR